MFTGIIEKIIKRKIETLSQKYILNINAMFKDIQKLDITDKNANIILKSNFVKHTDMINKMLINLIIDTGDLLKMLPIQPNILKKYVERVMTELVSLQTTDEYKKLYLSIVSVIKNHSKHIMDAIDNFNIKDTTRMRKTYELFSGVVFELLALISPIVLNIAYDVIGDGFIYDKPLTQIGVGPEIVYRIHSSIRLQELTLTKEDFDSVFDTYMLLIEKDNKT